MGARITARHATALLLALLATACQGARHRVHHSLLDEPGRTLPADALLLPVDVQMFEMSAGGILEEVPEWSRSATANVRASVDELVDARRAEGTNIFDVRGMPVLGPAEEKAVQEHLALYNVVAGEALNLTRSVRGLNKDWQHKLDRFDYSIGPGLSFLAARTGVRVGIVVTGVSIVPTTGRAVMSFLLGGVQTAAFLHIGVIDLETGALLWVNDGGGASQYDASMSFTSRHDVDGYVRRIIEPYPGLDEARALRKPAKETKR